MRSIRSLLGAALLAVPAGAGASVLVTGDSAAASCYKYAHNSVITDAALRECNQAFGAGLSADDRVATHVNRGIVHMLRNEDKPAETDFKAALKLDSTEAEAVLNLALLRLRQGNGEEALPLADKALALKTDRPALALYARGIANEYVGNLRAAYKDLNAAHLADPKWPLPLEELKRYQLIKKD